MAGTGRNTFWMHHRFSRRYRADDPGGQKRFHSQEGTDQNREIYPCLLCGVLPAAAIASGAGAGAVTQWLLFLAVSLVLLFFTRPLAVRYMKRGIPRTNVNSLIGKKAVVIQKIDNLSQTGQVRINDIEWMARTESDGETIPEESVVEIEAVRGVKLIVKKCKEEL